MIRKLKENKILATIVSVLLLAVANSVQQRFDVSAKDDVGRTRRAETWRTLMDVQEQCHALSNEVYQLKNPSTKKARRP